MESMLIRPALTVDRPHLERMVRDCCAFTDAEVTVAMELIDHHLDGTDPDYVVMCAAGIDDTPAGYICYGPLPGNSGMYDLYWIVVNPLLQRKGIGRGLVLWLEQELLKGAGRLLRADTASKPEYAGQRRFYESMGFRETTREKDFYAPGDDKVVYEKTIPLQKSLALAKIDMV